MRLRSRAQETTTLDCAKSHVATEERSTSMMRMSRMCLNRINHVVLPFVNFGGRTASTIPDRLETLQRFTVRTLSEKYRSGTAITAVTAYDYGSAKQVTCQLCLNILF